MPPFSAASVCPLSASFPLSFSSSSARLCLSVFCRHFHPCQTPRVFSVAPLAVLLSGPPAAIISPSPQHLFLPSIRATSVIFYPYTPTPFLSISLLYISIYLSIYLSSLTHFLSTLSLTHSLSLYISPRRLSPLASYSLSHSLLLNSPFSHYFTLYLSHTLSLKFYRATASPISLCPATNSIMAMISSHSPFSSSFGNWDGGGEGGGGFYYYPLRCTILSIPTLTTVPIL